MSSTMAMLDAEKNYVVSQILEVSNIFTREIKQINYLLHSK